MCVFAVCVYCILMKSLLGPQGLLEPAACLVFLMQVNGSHCCPGVPLLCCIIYNVCSITAERFVTVVLADLEHSRTVLNMPGSLHQLELCFQHYTSAQSVR